MPRHPIAAAYLLTFCVSAPSASAQCFVDNLIAPAAGPNDHFGAAIAVYADRTLIGAPLAEVGCPKVLPYYPAPPVFFECDSGVVFSFERSGGAFGLRGQLRSSDLGKGDRFGHAIAMDGNRAVVSAVAGVDAQDHRVGAAYVFEHDGTRWNEVQKLLASDGGSWDAFGSSVSLSGDRLLIGADSDDDPPQFGTGTAFVFTRTGGVWIEEAKFLASDRDTGDRFGTAVALSGDWALVGAPLNDILGPDSGSAYFFQRRGGAWNQIDRVTASDGGPNQRFGSALDIDGDQALIAGGGQAYVFELVGGQWVETHVFAAAGVESVDLADDVAILGGGGSGSTLIFERAAGGWSFEAELGPAQGLDLRGPVLRSGDDILSTRDELSGVAVFSLDGCTP